MNLTTAFRFHRNKEREGREKNEQQGGWHKERRKKDSGFASAFAHSITVLLTPQSQVEMRALAAKYMREHADDFIPFLTNADGDMLTPGRVEQGCEA